MPLLSRIRRRLAERKAERDDARRRLANAGLRFATVHHAERTERLSFLERLLLP